MPQTNFRGIDMVVAVAQPAPETTLAPVVDAEKTKTTATSKKKSSEASAAAAE